MLLSDDEVRDDVPTPVNATTEAPHPLEAPGARKALARRIKQDIDDYCADVYDSGHRNHLGASLIGHECSRYLWYTFRWVKHVKHSGRLQRLFQRGHLEEFRFVEWLRGIGFNVEEYQADGVTQFRVSGVGGHFGGSQDGQTTLPERYGIPGRFLLEFKTNGTGAGFTNVDKKGVSVAKPQHFAQMSTYGYKDNFDYAIYLIINKNDDDIIVEVVKLDKRLGEQCEKKATDVITARVPPAKLAENPTFMKCKWCDYRDICHGDEKVEKNCRSCEHATAADNGEWHCAIFSGNIPKDFIPQGCDKHSPIA